MPQRLDFINGDIPQLIRSIAIPVSVGMLFNTLYNVVDTWYAGLLSTTGIAALTLSFPVFFGLFSIGHGISTGSTALVANALGRKDEQDATNVFVQSLGFSALLSIVCGGAGLLFIRPLLMVMSKDMATVDMAETYLTYMFVGAPFLIVIGAVNASLFARGDTRSYRNVLIAGFLLNIGLNPLFMFGVPAVGIPGMGVAGIALATMVIQGGGMLYLFKRSASLGCFKSVTRRHFLPNFSVLKTIIAQAFPAALNMLLVAAGIFIINAFVARAGNTAAVAAYGIAMRIEQIALLPTIGLGTAMLTISGQNGGAGQFDRIRQAYGVSFRYGAVVLVLMLGAIVPFAPFWISLFDESVAVVRIGTMYLRIEMITFFAYFIVFLSISMLQGLKRPMVAVWVGLYRQVFAPLALFFVFISVLHFSVQSIWWGICGITWTAAIFMLIYSSHFLRNSVGFSKEQWGLNGLL